jgi:hypothetical protein
VNIDAISDLPDDDFPPSQSPGSGRLRRFFLLALAGLAVVFAASVVVVGRSPEFYRVRLPVGGPLADREPTAATAVAEQSARRLVTTASALHADFLKVGRWEGVFEERQLNAWLAVDLPRNHAGLLPASIASPRVQLLPGRLRAGVRVGQGWLAATVWVEAQLTLRDVNQLGITLLDARLGSLPLPRGPILRWIARRIEPLGAVTEIRRGEGQSLLVVYIPSTHQAGGVSHWLEAVRLADGELAVSGETRRGPVTPPPAR